VWQALYEELAAEGFMVITVAFERDVADALEWLDAANPTHPALIDTTWLLADLYNIEQVPTVVWIDESGRIVRPNDAAFGDNTFIEFTGIDANIHQGHLRRWVREGVHFDAAKVREHQQLPTDDDQLARAHFGLARYLWERGDRERAEPHFERAGELAPAHFTIRRGSMRMRDKDPMGQEFLDMMFEWTGQGKPLNKVIAE
jgi:tetratricopeptide (TPR) repeat protein